MTRESSSRPSSSTPIGWLHDGPGQQPFASSARFWSVGEYGASSGAKIATKTKSDHDREPDDRPRVAAYAPRRLPPQPARQVLLLDRPVFDLGERHQLTRILGLISPYAMSTSRFTITNTNARKRIPPCNTG